MSNVHIEMVEDARGDLVDLVYYHHGCAPADVPGWPSPEAIDYPVYCAACGARVEEVPLTEDGEREYGTRPGTCVAPASCLFVAGSPACSPGCRFWIDAADDEITREGRAMAQGGLI